MKYCASCKKEYPESAKFCRVCGGALSPWIQADADFQAKDALYKIKVKENPGDVESICEYARFLLENQVFPTVISLLTEFLDTSPKNLETRKLLAYTYKEAGNIDAYISQLLILEDISSNPNLDSCIDLAKAYIKKGNSESALEWVRKSLNIDPDNIEALRMLADISKNTEDTTTYLKTLDNLIQIDKANDAASELFHWHYANNDLVQAVKLAEKGYPALSDNPLVPFSIAKYFVSEYIKNRSGKLQVAKVFLDQILEIDSSLSDKELNEARILALYIDVIENKDFGLEPGLEWETWQKSASDPFYISVYATINTGHSIAMLNATKYKKAIQLCEKAIDFEPNEDRLYFLAKLFQLYAERLNSFGDRKDAIEYYKKALEILENRLNSTGNDVVDILEKIQKIEQKRKKSITIWVTVLAVLFILIIVIICTKYILNNKVDVVLKQSMSENQIDEWDSIRKTFNIGHEILIYAPRGNQSHLDFFKNLKSIEKSLWQLHHDSVYFTFKSIKGPHNYDVLHFENDTLYVEDSISWLEKNPSDWQTIAEQGAKYIYLSEKGDYGILRINVGIYNDFTDHFKLLESLRKTLPPNFKVASLELRKDCINDESIPVSTFAGYRIFIHLFFQGGISLNQMTIVDELSRKIEERKEIVSVASPSKIFRNINKALFGKDSLPESTAILTQQRFLLEDKGFQSLLLTPHAHRAIIVAYLQPKQLKLITEIMSEISQEIQSRKKLAELMNEISPREFHLIEATVIADPLAEENCGNMFYEKLAKMKNMF